MRSWNTSPSELRMRRSVLSVRLYWPLARSGSNGSTSSWQSLWIEISATLNCSRGSTKRLGVILCGWRPLPSSWKRVRQRACSPRNIRTTTEWGLWLCGSATKSIARPSSPLEPASGSPLTLPRFQRCHDTERIRPEPIADLDLQEPLLLRGRAINHGFVVGTSMSISFWWSAI
jgi:hypothetical protein